MIGKILLLAMCFTLTGCLMSIGSDHHYTHTSWDRYEAERMIVGSTTSVWITNTFGRPDSRVRYENGREVWEYENRGERDTRFSLFLILDVDLEIEHIETLSIELEDGVVTNYWIEEYRENH